MVQEKHFIDRSSWIRAAVLGANDGIISISSLAIGVAAANSTRDPVILATLAGLIAGALSMAAGEYVSVSSQSDLEEADIKRERSELADMPEEELKELAKVYEKRGLSEKLSMEIAEQLTANNPLKAHSRDELGITELAQAKPFQAAFSSAASFLVGGLFPLMVVLIFPIRLLIYYQYGFSIIFLAISGAFAAKLAGSPQWKSISRICIWGTFAMVISALVGYAFGI